MIGLNPWNMFLLGKIDLGWYIFESWQHFGYFSLVWGLQQNRKKKAKEALFIHSDLFLGDQL